MAIARWPRLSSREVARCRVFDIRADLCRSPRTGETHEFFVIECGDWVNVIPLTDDGEVLLVRQHRFGIDDLSLEIPGGMVDPGEDPFTAAGRELLEETGYAHRKLELLGEIHPNPALQKNRTFTYLATGCTPHSAPSLDTCEDLELVKLPLSRIDHLLRSGQISHALVAVAFLHLKLRDSPTGMTP